MTQIDALIDNPSPSTSNLETTFSHLQSLPNGKIRMGRVIESVSKSGFYPLLLTWCAFLIIVPIPKIPPLNFFFGMPFIFLGWQMLQGKEQPSLPSYFNEKTINGRYLKLSTNMIYKTLQKMEKFAQPSMTSLLSPYTNRFIGAITIFVAFVILLPLPLTNSPSASLLIIIYLGAIYKDMRFVLGGSILAVLWTTLIFSSLGEVLEDSAEWILQ